MDLRMHMGSNMIVAGPTSAGKTRFVMDLISDRHLLFDKVPTRIYWYHAVRTQDHDKMIKNGYIMRTGLPESFKKVQHNSIVVLDDLMETAKNSAAVTELFTTLSHHMSLFTIFIVQNLFFMSKEMRTRSLNAQYLVLFKNPRDVGQVTYLSRQIYPGKKNYLANIYAEATGDQHSYLFIDLHQATSELVRLRTNVLPADEGPMTTYVDKQAFNARGCV